MILKISLLISVLTSEALSEFSERTTRVFIFVIPLLELAEK